jgi:hypothetical protein
MHTSRDNYKAKWLASLPSTVQTGSEVLHEFQTGVNAVSHTQVNTAIELNRLRSTMIDAMNNAKDLVRLMDECQNVAMMDFGKTEHQIDAKIGNMDVIVMSRRIRDILKAAEARIGFLSAIADDQFKTGLQMQKELDTLQQPTLNLQSAAIETLIIGPKATETEMEHYNNPMRTEEFSRFGVPYEELEDDWVYSRIKAKGPSMHQSESKTNHHSKTDSGVDMSALVPHNASQSKSKNSKQTNKNGNISFD